MRPSTVPPPPVVQEAGAAPAVSESALEPAAPRTKTEVIRGNQRLITAPSRPGGAAAAAEGAVSLNFVNVEVHDLAKAILGDILGVNYDVGASAQGNVTVETARPVRREDVLPALEAGLKAAGMGLVKRASGYSILTLAEARRQPALVGDETQGFGTEAVSLRYASAAALKKLFDPMVPENAIQADPSRNVLLIAGSTAERKSLRAMIEQFDVNWLEGMSFALITLQRADSRRMVEELNQIVNAEGSPSAGLVRLVPLTRFNGIVVISPQPDYIEDVRYWAESLDRDGEGSERRLFVYRVQNGRASNLASVLTNVFGTGGTDNQTAASTTGAGGVGTAGTGTPAGMTSTTTSSRNSGQTSSFATSSPSVSPQGSASGVGLSRDSQLPAAAQQLRLAEGGHLVSVTSDDINNAIVVHATAREYESIENALRKLDVLPLQVLIEVMITEVTLNDTLRYGVEWYFKTGTSHFTLTSGSTNQPSQTFPGFSYLLSNGGGIQAVVNALDEVTTLNVVSSPQLLVLNNQTASIQVGDQVPVATQSSVSTTTSNAAIVNSIEYRDTGVILKVTPRVNDSGLVLLDVAQEVSAVTTTTTSSLDSPTIQQRRISSSVAVRDGQTVALGGLIRDTLTKEASGVPLLKDIPGVGYLFGSVDDTRVRTELMVLMTPRVVRSAVDAQAVTDELRRKISSMEPIPPQAGRAR
ncbi:type II secretion system secretin GspD [Telmatospirillum siberiense]|uniref:type II secretion system secretin GspD n=1 Tax=Telmatospirillum siberiense TaxID=382514 RepID=UPI001F53D412|nr:type II secretion system secretin GspD [Telmatospirillum siberiense]